MGRRQVATGVSGLRRRRLGMQLAEPAVRDRADFAHRPGSSPCAWMKESDLHRRLKAAILRAAVDAGWCGGCEVPGPGYRADVLVERGLASSGPDGVVGRRNVVYTSSAEPGTPRRVAFEVQLTRQGRADTWHRTDIYRRAGVEVVWLLSRRRHQVARHPRVVGVIDTEPLTVSVPRATGWVSEVSLEDFVGDVLGGRLRCTRGPAGSAWVSGPLRSDARPVSIPPLPSFRPEPTTGAVLVAPAPVSSPPPVLRREQAVRPSFWRRLLDLLLGRPE